MRRLLLLTVACAGLLLAWPAVSFAQTGTIAGTATDDTGAVLPGVTVEVTSPALIEKVRTAVTDGTGQYKIVQLPPGTYAVTFSLGGFNTVRRDNVQLTSDFTATINGVMKVGAVEETITVSGQSPVVDTQSVTQRTVMTRDVLDTVPTGRNIQAVGVMIPGASIQTGGGGAISRDVGGSGGLQQSPLSFRGSNDSVQTIEGLRLNNLCASGQFSGVYWNDGSLQEISYVTGADSAEMAQGGIRINMVPRDGGNQFHGSVVGNYTQGGWQANNLRSNLTSRGITNVSKIDKIYDVNPGVGGPIKKDKLWFYATFRRQGVGKTVVDSYYDADPSAYAYSPDLSRPGIDDGTIMSGVGRLSWQATTKDKLSIYHDQQSKTRPHWGISATVAPEASARQVTPTSFVDVTKWTRTQNSRLLFEAGVGIYDQEYTELYQPQVVGSNANTFDLNAIGASTVYSITEQNTGKVFNAYNAPADHFSLLRTYSGAVSYVTGAHAFRLGGALSEGNRRLVQRYTGDLTMTFRGGLPQSVTLRTPLDQRDGIRNDLGLYAQDRWTLGRATINAGLRYDWFVGQVLDEDLPASRWNNATHFDGFRVQNWKDLSPRLGVSYDLFGNGKTAVKASFARYVNGETVATVAQNNPETTIGSQDIRTWTDVNGDFTIFNPNGSVEPGELGSSTNANFGKLVASSTTTDPAVLNGFGVRPFNREWTASVQHELLPGVAINAGYYRRSFGNQTVINNQLTDPNAYDGPFCITAPNNPDLPNGGGYQVCGLYDIKSQFQGQVQNVRTSASNFGGITDVYQGLDLTMNARFKNGTFLQGGVNAQRRHQDYCNAPIIASVPGVTGTTNNQVDNPESVFCDTTSPFRPDVKFLVSQHLPGDVLVSAGYQFTQGPNILATWAAPNSVIAPALGRNLSAGATGTKTIQLIEPNTVYGENLNQLDLRASKRFTIRTLRFRVDADLYNALNSNWPFTLNNTFSTAASSQWLRPTNVLQGRLFKLGAQFDF
jgi:hypothetical protein